jgi:solute:Na+ symporter, SSS family
VKTLRLIFVLLLGIQYPGIANEGFNSASLIWKKVATLPHEVETGESKGYAGMFAGTHQEMIILAGGANFPNQPPWKGGEKQWSNNISVLKKTGDDYQWVSSGEYHLPKPLAYGSAVSTKEGVILIGGENKNGNQKDVYRLNWNPGTKKVTIETLTNLPWPLANTSAVILEDVIYLVGLHESNPEGIFLSMDLKSPHPEWKSLPTWPGAARTNAGLGIQTDGESEKLYLFGGRKKGKDGVSEVFAHSYSYDPSRQTWKKLSPIQMKGGKEVHLSAFSIYPIGSGHILLIGGVSPEPFNTLERFQTLLSDQKILPHERDSLLNERDRLLENHPGFNKSVFAYHTVTDSWTQLEDIPFTSPVNSILVPFQKTGLLISGEIYPGQRTPDIQELSIQSHQSFGTLNYFILIAYLAILVFIGFWVSRKQNNVGDFFKAGGRIPWWAAGISVFGTQLSAITFMAIPAKTFATDWTLFFLLLTIIMVSPLIIAWFLPFFRRLNLTTAYEYLELRFNRTVRIIGSLVYVTLQLGRLGIVLLLPSLALSVVTGIEVEVCILIMGVLSILYTVLGGIEAVIWTDVVQVGVLLGGALICLVLLVTSMEMSLSDFQTLAIDTKKTQIINFDLDFTGTAIWVVLFGGLASNLVQYGSDQTVIQRYLTTKDETTAAKGIRTGAWMALPSALIFFSIGTALYLFYLKNPDQLSPVIQNTDSIFPWYIVTQLPDGVSGLLIAAVFAAAMSSLDSSMNSVATVITTDFYQKLAHFTGSSLKELTFARIITILIGIGGTSLALWMATMGIPSLWDQFNMLIGLFAGGLGGIFLIGILSQRANAQGAILGFIGSAIVQVVIRYQTDLSIHLYALTGLASAMTITWLCSYFFEKPGKEKVQGLTLKTLLLNQKQPTSILKKSVEA